MANTPEFDTCYASTYARLIANQWALSKRNLKALIKRDKTEIKLLTKRIKLATMDTPEGQKIAHRKRQNRGYDTQHDRWEKQRRRQKLEARIVRAQKMLDEGRFSCCFGGKNLARRLNAVNQMIDADVAKERDLEEWFKGYEEAHEAVLSEWRASRIFIACDGRKVIGGNPNIRLTPVGSVADAVCTLTVKLPEKHEAFATPGVGLNGQKLLQLDAKIRWNLRKGPNRQRNNSYLEWLWRIEERLPIRYMLKPHPTRKNYWYLIASWSSTPEQSALALSLRRVPAKKMCVGIDTNVGHFDAQVLDKYGNPVGKPMTVHYKTKGTSKEIESSVWLAIRQILEAAKAAGAETVAIEDLNFDKIRSHGKEVGRKGKAGRTFRGKVSSIPTSVIRKAVVSLSYNIGLTPIAVDAAYTSRQGKKYWKPALDSTCQAGDGHTAAAIVIGRRSQGYKARRRRGRLCCDRSDRRKVNASRPEKERVVACLGGQSVEQNRSPNGNQQRTSISKNPTVMGSRLSTNQAGAAHLIVPGTVSDTQTCDADHHKELIGLSLTRH